MTYTLEQYKPAFQALVLQHIKTELPHEEWVRFRTGAQSGEKLLDRSFAHETQQTPESLTSECISEAVMPVSGFFADIHDHLFKEIGRINDEPVWYIENMGAYVWGLERDSVPCLEILSTFPSYPPGWPYG